MNRWARTVLFAAFVLAAVYLFVRARHGHNRQRVARRLGGLWNPPVKSPQEPESSDFTPVSRPAPANPIVPADVTTAAAPEPIETVTARPIEPDHPTSETSGTSETEPPAPNWAAWLKPEDNDVDPSAQDSAEPPVPPTVESLEPSDYETASSEVELDVVTSAFNHLAAEGAALEMEDALLAGLSEAGGDAELDAREGNITEEAEPLTAPPVVEMPAPGVVSAVETSTEASPAEADVVFPENLEEALAAMDHVAVRDRSARNAEAYLDEGNVYFNVGQYSLAIDRYGRALEMDDALVAAYYNRANALTRAGDYESALRDYDRALELQPGDADALNNRGMLHLYRAQYQEALRDFDLALGLEPADATVMVNRGLAYLHSGNPREALADFETATTFDANDAAASYGAGQAAAQLGNRQSAIRHLRRALQVDPGYSREAAADPKLAILQGDGDFIRLLRDAGAR